MVLDDLELLALTQKLGQQKLQTPWVAPSLGGQSIPKPTFDFGKGQLPPTSDKALSPGFIDKISKAWGGVSTKAKDLVTPFEKGTTGVKTGGEYLTKQLQTPIGRGTALMALLTAATELGIAVINETPCAAKFPIPPKKISKGILIIPPPIPSNPEPKPERIPMRIYNKIFSSNLELKLLPKYIL